MDIFGEALKDFYFRSGTETLELQNSYGDPEEMPVDIFFRTEQEMPQLELLALSRCRGKILDIGAGVGSHALLLQSLNKDVTAIEVSPGACDIMKHRGVKQVLNCDIMSFNDQQFDTILMLMNGIGLSGTFQGLDVLLSHLKNLLNPGGKILFDSSDISYLYDGTEKNSPNLPGEVCYQYIYKKKQGSWFNWLYVAAAQIRVIAEKNGYHFDLIYEDGEDQYLGSLTLRNTGKLH